MWSRGDKWHLLCTAGRALFHLCWDERERYKHAECLHGSHWGFFFFKNQVFVQMCNFLALLLWDKGEDSCPEPGALVHQSWVRERKIIQNKGTSAVFGGGQVIVVRRAFPHFYFIGLVWSSDVLRALSAKPMVSEGERCV